MLITYLSSTGSRPFFEGFKTILPVENDSDCQNQTRPYNLQVHMEKGFSFSILPLFRQNRNYSESAQIKKKIPLSYIPISYRTKYEPNRTTKIILNMLVIALYF